MRVSIGVGLAMAASVAFGTIAAHANPTFNLTYIAGTTAQQQAAFQAAANAWSARFTDNVTIDLTVGTGTLGSGILASTASAESVGSYSLIRSALTSNATSTVDAAAVAGLPTGSSFSVYINHTSDNPNGSGSATPYVDNNGSNNNAFIRLTNANAKALGLTPVAQVVGGCASACDGFIEFSNGFTYDYDRSNGISSGAFDFVGLAEHEIGHALGFISGVDVLDGNANAFPANAFTYVAPLDLYRCSAASVSAGADLDFAADNRAKSFSLNDCATVLGTFSTGITFGDGRQASHWKDNLGLGIMDPTAAPGELLVISSLDLIGFDAIGWELAVAEPAGLMVTGTWMASLLAARRRRRG